MKRRRRGESGVRHCNLTSPSLSAGAASRIDTHVLHLIPGEQSSWSLRELPNETVSV